MRQDFMPFGNLHTKRRIWQGIHYNSLDGNHVVLRNILTPFATGDQILEVQLCALSVASIPHWARASLLRRGWPEATLSALTPTLKLLLLCGDSMSEKLLRHRKHLANEKLDNNRLIFYA